MQGDAAALKPEPLPSPDPMLIVTCTELVRSPRTTQPDMLSGAPNGRISSSIAEVSHPTASSGSDVVAQLVSRTKPPRGSGNIQGSQDKLY
jgi:hypothetical protein